MQTIVSELSQCLDEWPSTRRFSIEDVLAEHPGFRNDSQAIEQLVVEEYVRRLESGERINPSTYRQRYPQLTPSLPRRLRNLAELHSRHCLLSIDAEMERKFPGPGDEINGYTLVEEIGRGAFSRVFLAEDGHVANRRVVVKTTYHGCAEIELLGPMSHPHLPRIFYCGQDPETRITSICMDWIGRRTLNDLITEIHQPRRRAARASHGRSAFATTITVIRQVADGLAFAHENGVLHLDVKPSNILLRENGDAVLIDFNLAVTASESHDVGFRGTMAYAAPEVIASAIDAGDDPPAVTAAADVFSLGTVLYELLTGELPWPELPTGRVEEAAMAAFTAKQKPVRRPSELNRASDRALDEIVLRALSPAPDDRFPTAREFCAALQDYSSPQRRSSFERRFVLALCAGIIVLTVDFSGSGAKTEQEPPFGDRFVSRAVPHDDVQSQLLTGWNHLLANDPDSALAIFNRALQSSDDPRLVASVGYAMLMRQSDEESWDESISESRDAFRRAIDGGLSNDVGVQCSLGYCYLQTKNSQGVRNFRGARKALNDALGIFADHESALFLRAIVESHMAQNEDREADRMFVDRLAGLPTKSSALLTEAVADYHPATDAISIDNQLALAVKQTSDERLLTTADNVTDRHVAGANNGLVLSLRPDFAEFLLPRLIARQ